MGADVRACLHAWMMVQLQPGDAHAWLALKLASFICGHHVTVAEGDDLVLSSLWPVSVQKQAMLPLLPATISS